MKNNYGKNLYGILVVCRVNGILKVRFFSGGRKRLVLGADVLFYILFDFLLKQEFREWSLVE